MITNLFCSEWALGALLLGFEKLILRRYGRRFFVFAENIFFKKWIVDKNDYCSNLSDFRILATKYILNKNFFVEQFDWK